MSEKVSAGVDLDALDDLLYDPTPDTIVVEPPLWHALIAELRAARAVVEAAHRWRDHTEIGYGGGYDSDLARALAEYDRLTGERQ